MAGVWSRGNIKLPYPFIDGLTKRQQEQIYEDFQALGKLGTGTRWATINIAASDSTAKSKDKADYVCTGTADNLKIQQAVDAISARSRAGRIVLLEGTYTFAAPVTLNETNTEIVIEGQSSGSRRATGSSITAPSGSLSNTVITGPSNINAFELSSGGTGTIYAFKNFSLIGFAIGWNMAAAVAVNLVLDHLHVNTNTKGVYSNYGSLSFDIGGLRVTHCIWEGTGEKQIECGQPMDALIMHNHFNIQGSGGPCGILLNTANAFQGRSVIVGNHFLNSGSGTADGIQVASLGSGAATHGILIANNAFWNFTGKSIVCHSDYALISGNLIVDSGTAGIVLSPPDFGGSTASQNAIIGNHIRGASSAGKGIWLPSDVHGLTDQASILANSVHNHGTSLHIETASNTRVIGNDFSGTVIDSGTGTVIDPVKLHASTHYTAGTDPLTGSLDANSRVGVRQNSAGSTFLRRRLNLIEGTRGKLTVGDDSVGEEVDITIDAKVSARKNSAGSVFTRGQLNFIEGAGTAITVADDAGSDEIDVTIAVTGSGSTIDVRKNSAGSVFTESRLNFIEGLGITLTIADDPGNTEVDITIAQASSAAVPPSVFVLMSNGFR